MAGGSADKGNMVKVSLAGVALLVAAVLIAWNFGMFDFLSKPPPAPELPPEIIKEHEAQKAKVKKQIESGEIPPPAGA